MAIQERTGSCELGPIDVAGKGKAMHRTTSESWSQESVALRAEAVDVMGGSCAESLDNQSRASGDQRALQSSLTVLAWGCFQA